MQRKSRTSQNMGMAGERKRGSPHSGGKPSQHRQPKQGDLESLIKSINQCILLKYMKNKISKVGRRGLGHVSTFGGLGQIHYWVKN